MRLLSIALRIRGTCTTASNTSRTLATGLPWRRANSLNGKVDKQVSAMRAVMCVVAPVYAVVTAAAGGIGLVAVGVGVR